MDKKLIRQQRLENDIVLSIYDHSHKVAGDRVLIKIECEAAMPVHEQYFEKKEELNRELTDRIRNKLGKNINFSVFKERNFVAEAEADAAKGELIGQIYENMAEYLAKPSFPEKFFMKRYEELKKLCLLAQHVKQPDEFEEDDGPADFSACFKD